MEALYSVGGALCLLGVVVAVVLTLKGAYGTRPQATDKMDKGLAPELKGTPKESRTDIFEREAFWNCANCGQEFRLPYSGLPPVCCPHCGDKLKSFNGVAEEEAHSEIFMCPHCKAGIEMLDGDAPNHCPCCGLEIK